MNKFLFESKNNRTNHGRITISSNKSSKNRMEKKPSLIPEAGERLQKGTTKIIKIDKSRNSEESQMKISRRIVPQGIKKIAFDLVLQLFKTRIVRQMDSVCYLFIKKDYLDCEVRYS